jgi:hypothetical protein
MGWGHVWREFGHSGQRSPLERGIRNYFLMKQRKLEIKIIMIIIINIVDDFNM